MKKTQKKPQKSWDTNLSDGNKIDKGAPLHSLLDSGARHLAKVMSGYTDEDHLRAACWNLLWALQERTTHPELNDTPWPWYKRTDE